MILLIRSLLSFIFFFFVFLSFGQKTAIWFYPNKGQWNNEVLYKTPLGIGDFFIDKQGFTYGLLEENPIPHNEEHQYKRNKSIDNEKIRYDVIKTAFIGANFENNKSSDQSSHYNNYFLGDDSTRWQGNIFGFKKVEILSLYENVSMFIEAKANSIEYSFIVENNQDPSVIKMKIDGSQKNHIDKDGNLHIKTRFGEILNKKPKAWILDEISGLKKQIDIEFQLFNSILSYKINDKYDSKQRLYIDPEIIFSSFTGSIADNRGFTATPDQNGNLIAGGVAFGMGYPTKSGSYDLDFNGGETSYTDDQNNTYVLKHSAVDLTISKFNSKGDDLVFSTFIGGSGNETPHSMVCDKNNDLYIFGATSSSDFPISSKSYDNSFNGGKFPAKRTNIFLPKTDIYVLRLNANGSDLKASTYIGGSKNDGISDSALCYNSGDEFRGEIIVSSDNNIVVSSNTNSDDFPTLNSFQSNLRGYQDAVIFKLSPNLDQLIWSSYFGGNDLETGNAVQSADDGSLYVTGGTTSQDLTFSGGNQSSYSGGHSDGFIIKLVGNKPLIKSGTFIGSTAYDQGFFVQLDKSSNVYIYGQSEGNLPISPGKYGVSNSGQFIRKYSNDLKTLLWNTTFGTGSGYVDLSPTAFSVSTCGDIYISGWGGIKNRLYSKSTYSTTIGLEVTNDAFQNQTNGNNFYVAVFGDDAKKLSYATFMGGLSVANNHVDGGTSRFDKRGGIFQAVCAGCGSVRDGFSTTPNVFSPYNLADSNGCNLAAFEFDLKGSISKISLNDSVFCSNDSIRFLNLSVNCDSFKWDFGDGESSTEKEPIHKYKKPGKYFIKLIGYDSKTTCSLADTAETELNIFNKNDKIINPVTNVCYGAEINLISPEIGVYLWKPDSLFTPNNESQIVANIYKDITIELHIEKGCRNIDISYPYKIIKNNMSQNQTYQVCDGGSSELKVTGGIDYVWEPSIYLNQSNTASVICKPSDSITYLVKKKVSSNCFVVDTIKVEVIPKDKSILLDSSISLCLNDSKIITISKNEKISFNPMQGINVISQNKFEVKPSSDINYNIVYDYLCGIKTQTLSVKVHPLPSISIQKDTIICLNGKARISCKGGISYNWLVDNDVQYLTYNGSEANVSPKKSTKYIIQGEDENRCKDIDSVFVQVYDPPVIKTKTNYNAYWGDVLKLNVQVISKHNGFFIWKPSELLSCSDCSSPSILPTQDTELFVYFIDTNQCTDSIKININFEGDLFVPNSFTPNNDGDNDKFMPVSHGITDFQMDIYNRWGELIITLNSIEQFWDGRYRGIEAPDGVYNWQLNYSTKLGKYISRSGHVSLFR